jgi:diaminohydroxyphosphoribosylaminopyrimidine deaminase/5-amino-6-(5-phosphoribosylamino)uracil reductase
MDHETYMARCIQLAENGLGRTYPNPLVGSVIVYKDTIIGEGWHRKAGEPHAEVNAVNSVKDKSLLSESTLYVNLEPCSHFGKTPPCSDMINSQGISHVVIGTSDPNILVAGKGIEKLKAAGIDVTIGVLERECLELNRRFFTFHSKNRPFIILKWAETADGFIAPLQKENREPVWITNTYSRQLVHKWRSEEDAIFVGTNTVIDDDPMLNVRDWAGNNPVKIVLDRSGKIPTESKIFHGTKTIVITENIEENRENLVFEYADFKSELPRQLLEIMSRNGISSVIVEGGSQTLQTFIDSNLWDEMRIFQSNVTFSEGIPAPRYEMKNPKFESVLNDRLLIIHNND